MTKVPQSKDDLTKHLKEQIQFLNSSIKAYDNGSTGEAKRLATVIRVLVHDTSNSKSLLMQLGLKNILFFDTSLNYDATQPFPFNGLVLIKASVNGGRFVPRCELPPKPGENPKLVPFDTWWNKIVIVDTKRDRFTRKDIILTLSNTSGGAHVDPYLDEAYANLTKHNSMGWRYKVGNIEGDFINIELASARQIAQEILYSLQHAEFFS